MSHDPQAHRWLLEWSDDSGDPDHDIRATADTVEEARAAMDRILTGVTWTPEDAREFGGDQNRTGIYGSPSRIVQWRHGHRPCRSGRQGYRVPLR